MIHNLNFSCIFRRFKIVYTRGTISRRTWFPRVDSKKISVVLLKDSENLGKSGEIIETSRGYANYHLIPNGIAAYANWYNIDLYCKSASLDPSHPFKDKRQKGIEDLYSLSSKPEYILFGSRLANYVVSFEVNTFASDKTRLSSPISLYQVLDRFSNQYHIDLLPSQISEVKFLETDTQLPLLQDFEYLTFSNIGNYEITVDFPLNIDHHNKLEFRLEISPLQFGKKAESETFQFYLPKSS